MPSLMKKLQNNTFKLSLVFLLSFGMSPYIHAEEVESTDTTEASTPEISEEQTLHTNLVLTALKADFFNKRCRGISVAKSFNKVNRLFVTKYSLTANNYIKTYMNADVKQYKVELERDFKKSLNKIGGCKQTKKLDWRGNLRKEFNQLYRDADRSTWFPEEL